MKKFLIACFLFSNFILQSNVIINRYISERSEFMPEILEDFCSGNFSNDCYILWFEGESLFCIQKGINFLFLQSLMIQFPKLKNDLSCLKEMCENTAYRYEQDLINSLDTYFSKDSFFLSIFICGQFSHTQACDESFFYKRSLDSNDDSGCDPKRRKLNSSDMDQD